MLKVVLDTNLLIDAASDFYNYGNRIIDLVLAGQVEAYANKSTLKENKFIVEKKINDEGFLKKLEYFFEAVKPVENIVRLNVVEDSQDNKILESAVAIHADFLITSDRHLLKIENYQSVRIVRPNQFWSIYQEEGEGGWKKWLESFIR
jgi:putative PIN family toxin of toxin-antitoxin system